MDCSRCGHRPEPLRRVTVVAERGRHERRREPVGGARSGRPRVVEVRAAGAGVRHAGAEGARPRPTAEAVDGGEVVRRWLFVAGRQVERGWLISGARRQVVLVVVVHN